MRRPNGTNHAETLSSFSPSINLIDMTLEQLKQTIDGLTAEEQLFAAAYIQAQRMTADGEKKCGAAKPRLLRERVYRPSPSSNCTKAWSVVVCDACRTGPPANKLSKCFSTSTPTAALN
jgi:hypothetical protein